LLDRAGHWLAHRRQAGAAWRAAGMQLRERHEPAVVAILVPSRALFTLCVKPTGICVIDPAGQVPASKPVTPRGPNRARISSRLMNSIGAPTRPPPRRLADSRGNG
jgi:hypothetical protein